MVTIVNAQILDGYTGYDHLIGRSDEDRVRGFVGRSYPSANKALAAVVAAYERKCDSRVETARVQVAVVSDRRYPQPVWIG